MPLPSCLRLAAGAGGGDDDTAEARLHPAVEAVARPGGLGFAFSGGGFLAPYHIGVADSLERCGVLKRDSPLGGASAGSLVAATFRAGMPIESMMSEFLVLAADLRASGTVRKLGATLQAHLERVLPHDSHERLGGSTHIAVTTLRRFPRVLRRELLSSFACRDDLIHSLLASCHLPLYSAGSVAHLHGKRAVRMIDGGVTDLIPVPTSAAHTVKVSCVPEHFISRMPILNKREALRDLAICLGRYEPWPYTFKQMVRAAKAPADVPFLLDLLDRGRRDAVKWAASVGLISFLALRQPGAAASAAVGSAAGSSATCKAAAAQEQQRLSSHSIVVDAEAQEDADNEAAAAAVAAEYVRCAVLASVATPVPAAAK